MFKIFKLKLANVWVPSKLFTFEWLMQPEEGCDLVSAK